jgi:hypothetical protein
MSRRLQMDCLRSISVDVVYTKQVLLAKSLFYNGGTPVAFRSSYGHVGPCKKGDFMKIVKSLAAVGAATFLSLASLSSHSAVTLLLDDLSTAGVDVTVTDNGAGDFLGLADAITYVGSAGSFNINVTTGLGDANTPALFGLDLNSINTSLGAGTLRITLIETGYSLSGSTTFTGEIGGTTTGSIAWQMFVDDNNVGGYGVGSSVMSGVGGPGAFSDSGSASLSVTDPFAMTLAVDITHGVRGGTSSFDFAGSIPEPSTLALVGFALLGLGTTRRSRK